MTTHQQATPTLTFLASIFTVFLTCWSWGALAAATGQAPQVPDEGLRNAPGDASGLEPAIYSAQTASERRQTEPTLVRQFANPPQTARPHIRFWTPAAAVSESGLRRDIETIAQYGFGGLEIVALAVPKGLGDEYAWGSEAWNRLMNTAAAQAGKNGIIVDFTNGPQWPIAMPGLKSADDPAALYEMTYGVTVLQPGQSFSGPVPERRKVREEGTTRLAAVLAYRVAGDMVLDAASVIDLTAAVQIDATDHAKSTLEFTAPAGSDPWVLFAYWEQPAAQKTGGFYVIDHFGAAGAKASVDYWENIAFPAMRENLKHVRSIFNDSLEYAVTMEWTRGFQQIFKQQHGYDLTPFLPFAGSGTTYPANDIPPYTASDRELVSKVQHDYRKTLTMLYRQNHLEPLEHMAERHGLTQRYQVAYNKPMEIEASALAVGIPETEALGRVAIDMQRWMAGAVHLAGKPYYSIETSAELWNAYGQTLQDILWWNKRAWAAGVNVQRFHGQSYSGRFDGPGNVDGQLPGQKWPGYSPMSVGFSNEWLRQTSPEALRQIVDFMARVNLILQKTAKVDVAIYNDSPDIFNNPSMSHGDGTSLYPDGGVLNAHGFSYEFVSPTLLDLPQATVTNGLLAADGPAYKALVFHRERAATMRVIERLQQFASAGLKIVFVGELPSRNSSYADQLRGHSDADIRAALADLLRLPTVAEAVDYAAVPATLHRLGVRADAEAVSPADLLTQHRTDATGDYYYIYNYNKVASADAKLRPSGRTAYPPIDKATQFVAKTARFSLAGTGRPYLLDGWTGRISPIPQFTASAGRVEVTVSLAGDEAVLIGLLTDEQARAIGLEPPRVWALNADTPYDRLCYVDDASLALKAKHNGSYTIRLNTGRDAAAKVSDLQAERAVEDWILTVESIEAPANGSALFHDSTWRTVGPFALGAILKPWAELDPALARLSGVGTYTGTFTLDRGYEQGGSAFLDLGTIDDAFAVTINGRPLPPLDLAKSAVDLGSYAKQGVNSVSVRVATTLYNMIAPIPGKTYGLLGTRGTVTVAPYRLLPLDEK